MSPRLPADLLDRSPEESTRRLALAYLREANAAHERLGRSDDAEALHDFRVAVRRLRSCCQVYRDALDGSVPKKLRRRLRDITRATNRSRDQQVMTEWVQLQRTLMSPTTAAGADWLLARIATAGEPDPVPTADGLGAEWAPLAETLKARLSAFEMVVHLEGAHRRRPFRSLAAERLAAVSARLQARLDLVKGVADEEAAHQARIEAKRLRYLLEPLVRRASAGRRLVRRLKGLQDLVGEVRDLQLLIGELDRGVEAATAEREYQPQPDAPQEGPARTTPPDDREPVAGLVELKWRAQDRIVELFRQFEQSWLGTHPAEFFSQLTGFQRQLARRPRAPVEIERKYLLSRVPERARDAPATEIHQGWIPGEAIHERLRRAQTGATVRFTRTLKFGTGLRRTELEEETSREIFESLWPLTAGRRVEKRRYTVSAGELAWEVDLFLDRDLVLAEVELPDEATEVPIPDWLAPCLVREVTGEPEYVNLNLAR